MPEFEPERILEILAAHEVAYVLIGGFAAITHGSPFLTEDVDVTPERGVANLDRLSAALKTLGAQGVEGGLPFDHDGESLASEGVWNLTTRYGDLDISFVPTGTQGYADLLRGASERSIAGVAVHIASLEDIVRSKQAANRDKDRRVLPTLRELLANRDLDKK